MASALAENPSLPHAVDRWIAWPFHADRDLLSASKPILDTKHPADLGTVDWDALCHGCRAPFFDDSTKARKKAKAGSKKQVARGA